LSAPLFAMRSSPGRSRLRRLRALWIAALSACVGLLAAAGPAGAVNSVVTANGATWQVHDAAQPGLDTGSLRTVSNSGVQGFGNIIVDVSTDPRMDGQMMRGFGLRFDGLDRFKTTQAVDLGGISITRSLRINRAGNWGRFFDTFTNTTGAPIVVKVSFGGALGYNSGTNQSFVAASSSGDTFITQDDSWTIVRTGANNQRPVGVVTGSPDLGLAGMGNHELDPFTDPLPTTGMAANFYGYVSQFTVEPGKTKSLARFVVIGPTGADATADTQEAVEDLAEDPDFSDLSTAEICSLVKWDLTELDAVDPDDCDAVKPLDVPPAPSDEAPKTASAYDVVGKTIAELQADMEAGVTTSEEITRAYLDRIRVYDTGQFGFHAYITVAEDAIAQARAADQARREGAKGELLGIPIAIKDLYDTKDMPTTDGTLALEGWQPKRDAYQVELLREAGAVIIGKTNLSQFANSGSYSESGWGPGVERPVPVEDVVRLERRLGGRGRDQHGRGGDGHADRRLAVRAVDRGEPRHVPRDGRHGEHPRRDAAHLGAGLRGADRPHGDRPRLPAERDHGHRPRGHAAHRRGRRAPARGLDGLPRRGRS